MSEPFNISKDTELLIPVDFARFGNAFESISILEVEMPKCTECGAETDLHELDLPICPGCITERGHGPSIENLREELAAAKDLYRKAREEFENYQAICRDHPQGPSCRATATRMEGNAKAAGERYFEALRVYSDAVHRDDE